MTYEELGYMGRYAREYKPRAISYHRTVNDIFGNPPVRFIPSSVAIVQQKKIPDVSFYQGEIDFTKMRQQTDALIIRAGQNLWKDSQFDNNWRLAKQHGIKRGSYWFYDDRVSPGKQADLWASLLRDDYPEMEIYVDWENSYGGQYGNLRDVVAMMQAMERLLPGVTVGEYTGYFWHVEHSNAVTHASQYAYLRTRPLFLAWYTANAANVLIPNPWTAIYLWQYGTPAVGREYGVKTAEIDLSYINMTEAEFQRVYGATEPPTEPEEPTMERWKVTWDNGANRRPQPNVNNDPITPKLLDNAEFDVIGYHVPPGMTEAQERWGRLVDLTWVALTYNSLPRAVLVSAPPPPAEVAPAEITVRLNDGSVWKATSFQKVS